VEVAVARHPVGSKIKEAREPTGLSAYEFSNIAHIPFARYQAIEAGKEVATDVEAWAIAEALAPTPEDADPIGFYEPADPERYRGGHSRIAAPVTQAEQERIFSREQDLRRQAELRQWRRGATSEVVKQHPEMIQELRTLDMKLDGRSDVSDAWASAIGVEAPAARSVADHNLLSGR
jgi:hypothetical protein